MLAGSFKSPGGLVSLNLGVNRSRRARAGGRSKAHLGAGSRESLAGRFERITLAHWSASSLAQVFHLPPPDAVQVLIRMGTYPGAFAYRADLKRWSAYVRDAILEPAIGRDLLALAAVRKPALLRQVFGVCASSPAQIVSLQKIQGQLQDAGALETVARYLALLEEAFLVAPLDKHSLHPVRRRSAPPKLITLSNAFLAAVDPRGIPDQNADLHVSERGSRTRASHTRGAPNSASVIGGKSPWRSTACLMAVGEDGQLR